MRQGSGYLDAASSEPLHPAARETLLAALDLPPGEGRTVEIGGADQVTYGDIMREYAAQRGLRRWLIPVPVLTPRLSSLWLRLNQSNQ